MLDLDRRHQALTARKAKGQSRDSGGNMEHFFEQA